MFALGQEVFSSRYGKGAVTRIDEEALFYPVQVTFQDLRHVCLGQEVFSSRYGKGAVTRIDEEALFYPVQVTFQDLRHV